MFYFSLSPKEIVLYNSDYLPDYYFGELLHVWVYPGRLRVNLPIVSVNQVIANAIRLISITYQEKQK